MDKAELHTSLREVVAIGRRGGYDNDEIAEKLAGVVRDYANDFAAMKLTEAAVLALPIRTNRSTQSRGGLRMTAERFHYEAAELIGSEPINHPELHRALCGRVADALAEAELRGRAEALSEAADTWQRGAWADTPRHSDRIADRIAAAQFVTDWLRARVPVAEESA